MTFAPVIQAQSPGRELRWLGRVLLPGLFDGEHVFAIEPRGVGVTRFVHREHFSGLLVPLLAKRLEANTRRGFVAMNEALKARCEQEYRVQ